jgi:hypothetical protein
MRSAIQNSSDAMRIHTKFHEDWFRHSKVVSRDTRADTQIAK